MAHTYLFADRYSGSEAKMRYIRDDPDIRLDKHERRARCQACDKGYSIVTLPSRIDVRDLIKHKLECKSLQ